MSFFDNGFHFMAVCVLICVYLWWRIVVGIGRFIHEGMGPDGQEGGAK